MDKNCWGCGEVLERVTDEPTIIDGHAYCSPHCVWRSAHHDDEPRDYDEQDRRVAAEERIQNHRNER